MRSRLRRAAVDAEVGPMFAKGLAFLEALPPAILGSVLLTLTAMIGVVDYFVSADASLSAVYLFPICMAAWFLGRRFAYALAVISPVLWVAGDLMSGVRYASPLIPLWNLLARFAIFVLALNLIAELRKLHTELEARANERAAKLTAEIETRERLEHELLNISEREQRRVGHDIHDSLCQHLTGTALASQVLAENLKAQGSPQADRAARIVELVEQGITLSRDLARGLNSVKLSTDGLMEALEDFAASTSDLFNISCRFECPLPVLIDDSDAAAHLYRIAQEAVGNAIKHGRAKNVVIRLEASHAGKILRVFDDGVGLPASLNGSGMGLRIMSYRARLIGAKFHIRRREVAGTVVTCMLPMQRQRELVS